MAKKASAKASIAFTSVAACFTEEEWNLLEEWQRLLYEDVMKDVHGALISLGYSILNPDTLLKVKMAEEDRYVDDEKKQCDVPAKGCSDVKPEIVMKIKHLKEEDSGSLGEKSSSGPVADFQKNFLIKEEEEGYEINKTITGEENPAGFDCSPSPSEKNQLSGVEPQDQCTVEGGPIFDTVTMVQIKEENNLDAAVQQIWSSRENLSINASGGPIVDTVTMVQIKEEDHLDATVQQNCSSRENLSTNALGGPIFDTVTMVQIKEEDPLDAAVQQNWSSGENLSTNASDSSSDETSSQNAHLEVEENDQEPAVDSMQNNCVLRDLSTATLESIHGLIRNARVRKRKIKEERPHKCIVCDRCFTRHSNLVAHYRTHTGERPYECHQCHKTFINKSNLCRHVRIHVRQNL
ncbi:zinc finger protein 33A-like isoform X2 [Spea bombifrons]|uniref:zinc finger protein 33A-like isoform X2 n=1 Tax=Spea bombifrons TaxID=233779 RepID=UPI00234B4774|nr:zinc finger protein 33A-like isoform X2 [Spea bombifrons]